MSTQQGVTEQGLSPDTGSSLVAAFWLWLGAAVIVAALSLIFGGSLAPVAGASAVALAMGAAGFLLAPRAATISAGVCLAAAWWVGAACLAAATGGAHSPLSALFLALPAIAAALNARWIAEATAAAVLGYPVAAALSLWLGPTIGLGPFAQLLAAAGIVFTGGLALTALTSRRAAKGVEVRAGRQLAEAAHELRTPLNHIMGFADVIEQEVFAPVGDRNKEYARLIRESGGRLLEMINDLLDLSRLEAGAADMHMERFDLSALAADVVREFAHAGAQKGINVVSNSGTAPIQVHADETAWRRIITNLLGNAVKFTPEGGRVSVRVIEWEGRAVVEVSDTGPGFPEALRAQLAKPYQRGEGLQNVEGSGLGLSLVRALVDAHGGTLKLGKVTGGGGALVRASAPILSS